VAGVWLLQAGPGRNAAGCWPGTGSGACRWRSGVDLHVHSRRPAGASIKLCLDGIVKDNKNLI
jgi:hypothetical protein